MKDTSPNRFDPDARFLLANERTLLAWIRTSLALQVGGLVLAHFSSGSKIQSLLSIVIVALGGLMALIGYTRFRAADRAIRAQQVLSMGYAPAVQTGAVVLIAAALIAGIILGAR